MLTQVPETYQSLQRPKRTCSHLLYDQTRGNVALKDGEHDEFVWLEPSALRYYDTVPYCVETILMAERET